jgi:hypothetical protein
MGEGMAVLDRTNGSLSVDGEGMEATGGIEDAAWPGRVRFDHSTFYP